MNYFLYKNKNLTFNARNNPTNEKILIPTLNSLFKVNANNQFNIIINSKITNNTIHEETNKLKQITTENTSTGFEFTNKYKDKTYVIINENIPEPKLSTTEIIDNDITIKIFNPKKTKSYKNITLKLNTTNNIGTITIKNLTNDNIINTQEFSNNIFFSELKPENYIEIITTNITNYVLTAIE
ncbi:hypothetical protein JXM83_01065 [Candidatus Woesearchaeota archaeon]|nr:hypothetical protein [Candidatus Woesearchaeota archaeon]